MEQKKLLKLNDNYKRKIEAVITIKRSGNLTI